MVVDYTERQMEVVEQMVKTCEAFADQLLHIMQNHKLDMVDGCKVQIDVDPAYPLTARVVQFGKRHIDVEKADFRQDDFYPSGYVRIAKGLHDSRYKSFGMNSPEYEVMFAPPEIKEQMKGRHEQKPVEKELPPDGMWIGNWTQGGEKDV